MATPSKSRTTGCTARSSCSMSGHHLTIVWRSSESDLAESPLCEDASIHNHKPDVPDRGIRLTAIPRL